MKKFLALLLCILMAFCVIACDKKKEKGGSDDDEGGSSNKPQQSVSFSVSYNSTKIALGADAKAVIAALGEPVSKQDAGSCAGQGTLTKYKYPSIEIYVLTNGSSETIDQISFLDDGVKTSEGVKIGSSADEVTKACGKATKQTDSYMTYTSGKKSLQFQFRDGAVVGIDYRMVTN